MHPLISIQIPTYKQATILHKAIESCLAQDYPNLEIVIADDNSPDNTEAVVAPYLTDARVRYFKNEKNLGRVGNYRQALQQYVTGEWVVNLDGDDYFTNPAFLSSCVALLNQNQDQKLVLLLNQNGYVQGTCHPLQQLNDFHYCLMSGADFLTGYSRFPTFFHLASLFNREAALLKDFYTSDTLNSDFVSLLQLADAGNFIVSDLPAGEWNFNENSDTQNLNLETAQKGLRAVSHMVDGLQLPPAVKEKARRELLFVSNFYYATNMKGSGVAKMKQLFRHPKGHLLFLKGIAKIVLNR